MSFSVLPPTFPSGLIDPVIDPACIIAGITTIVVLIAVFAIVVVVVLVVVFIEALFDWCTEAIVIIKLPLESVGRPWPVGLEGGHGFCTHPWRSSEWHSDEVHRRVFCLPGVA